MFVLKIERIRNADILHMNSYFWKGPEKAYISIVEHYITVDALAELLFYLGD
jgi:hypothetical protein